jgi:hypothetical protein
MVRIEPPRSRHIGADDVAAAAYLLSDDAANVAATTLGGASG